MLNLPMVDCNIDVAATSDRQEGGGQDAATSDDAKDASREIRTGTAATSSTATSSTTGSTATSSTAGSTVSGNPPKRTREAVNERLIHTTVQEGAE